VCPKLTEPLSDECGLRDSRRKRNVKRALLWCQIAGLDDIADMDKSGAYSKDSHGDDGCLTETVAAAHGDNSENTDCQIGKPTSS
jgi:hypothetical protein